MEFFKAHQYYWRQIQKVDNRQFDCGYCGRHVASDRGYIVGENGQGSGPQRAGIYICPNCNGPNFLDIQKNWYPGQPFGRYVENVPEDLNDLYEEARRCHKEKCYTAAVLLCRKMLMNIAVDQGAKPNLQFIKYVNFLGDNGFIPPNGKKWIDHIRKKGNEATHEINPMDVSDSKDLISFTEMILVFLYEFPSRIPDSETNE